MQHVDLRQTARGAGGDKEPPRDDGHGVDKVGGGRAAHAGRLAIVEAARAHLGPMLAVDAAIHEAAARVCIVDAHVQRSVVFGENPRFIVVVERRGRVHRRVKVGVAAQNAHLLLPQFLVGRQFHAPDLGVARVSGCDVLGAQVQMPARRPLENHQGIDRCVGQVAQAGQCDRRPDFGIHRAKDAALPGGGFHGQIQAAIRLHHAAHGDVRRLTQPKIKQPLPGDAIVSAEEFRAHQVVRAGIQGVLVHVHRRHVLIPPRRGTGLTKAIFRQLGPDVGGAGHAPPHLRAIKAARDAGANV